MNFDAIREQVEQGFISWQKHPSADLYILNYTQRAQYDWHWTPETMACRGLIVDGQNNIVSRPFLKFFSIEQRQEPLPLEPFEVYEKLDGSLGILYYAHGEPRIATRGSFVSEQAQWATYHLHEKYGHVKFDPTLTYLFEIIYPGNRIVVDYGDTADLFLLAVIDTETGKDVPLQDIGIPVVKRYDGIKDVAELSALEEANKEGFVLKFESGLRVKVKFAEYKRLHRLLTGLNSKQIWECLKDGRGLNDVLERVPDEFYNWVRATERDLVAAFKGIEDGCRAQFKDLGDRKENALYYRTCEHPAVLFKMLDGQDYSDYIWKQVRPVAAMPFKIDEE